MATILTRGDVQFGTFDSISDTSVPIVCEKSTIDPLVPFLAPVPVNLTHIHQCLYDGRIAGGGSYDIYMADAGSWNCFIWNTCWMYPYLYIVNRYVMYRCARVESWNISNKPNEKYKQIQNIINIHYVSDSLI